MVVLIDSRKRPPSLLGHLKLCVNVIFPLIRLHNISVENVAGTKSRGTIKCREIFLMTSATLSTIFCSFYLFRDI